MTAGAQHSGQAPGPHVEHAVQAGAFAGPPLAGTLHAAPCLAHRTGLPVHRMRNGTDGTDWNAGTGQAGGRDMRTAAPPGAGPSHGRWQRRAERPAAEIR